MTERSETFEIVAARTGLDYAEAERLFRAYAASLDIDLSFQNFEAEVAGLPGGYAPPRGELLIARSAKGAAVACVALRAIEPDGCCEMKRLYVATEARGHGLGERLVTAIIAVATGLGYREMRLDTMPSMATAIALYRRNGFVDCAPYYTTPTACSIFMVRPLG